MTLVPEINLAGELSMCYGMIATVTDYDAWSDTAVEASDVMNIMKEMKKRFQIYYIMLFLKLTIKEIATVL